MHIYGEVCVHAPLSREGFPRSAGEGLERLLPTPPPTVLQGLMWSSYWERKRSLHSIFINVKWQGKLLRDSSFSPAWPSLGHGRKTRQPFSNELLQSAKQIEALDKLLLSSCSDPGQKQPITHKQVQAQPSLLSCREPEQARRGQGGRDGWGGLDVNISIFLGCATLRLCKTLWMCNMVLLAHGFVFPKISCQHEKILGFYRTCVYEIVPCVEKASKPCGPYGRVILIAFSTCIHAPVCTHVWCNFHKQFDLK